MEMFSWVTVGMLMVVGGCCMFLGAGIGHYQGYKRGYNEGRIYQKLRHRARYGMDE